MIMVTFLQNSVVGMILALCPPLVSRNYLVGIDLEIISEIYHQLLDPPLQIRIRNVGRHVRLEIRE